MTIANIDDGRCLFKNQKTLRLSHLSVYNEQSILVFEKKTNLGINVKCFDSIYVISFLTNSKQNNKIKKKMFLKLIDTKEVHA